jgi:hypothetical protein
MTIHLGCPLPDTSRDQPEPPAGKAAHAYAGKGTAMLCGSYSVLLLVGFALPLALPQTRCALTAPFHPYLSLTRRFAGVATGNAASE